MTLALTGRAMKAVSRFLHLHRRLYFVISYAVANGMPSLASLILVMIYTSAMNVDEFGCYCVLTAIIGLLAVGVELGIPAGLMRDYFDCHRDANVKRFLASGIRGYMVVSVGVLPLAAIVVYALWPPQIEGLWHTLGLIAIVLLITYLERIVELSGSISRALEVPQFYVIGRATNAFCTIAMGVVAVGVLHGAVFGALLARLCGAVAGCVVYRRQMRSLGIRGGTMSWPQMCSAARFGLPLLPNRLALWMQHQGLRPVLMRFASTATVGHFSLAFSVAFMPLMLTAVVEQVLFPVYFKRRVDGGESFDGKIRQFADVMMGCVFAMFAGLILFSRESVIIVGGSRYLEAVPACAFMTGAAFLRTMSSFVLRQIQYSRRTWLQPIVTVPSATLAVLLTALFAARWGIMAAAWAAVASEVAMMIGLAYAARRIESLQLSLSAVLVLFAVLFGLAWLVSANVIPGGLILSGVIRLALLAAIVAIAYAIWIAPNRIFVRHLISR